MKLFEGRTAMVTGAGKNMGKEIALAFAKNGANVIVCDYNEEAATQTAEEIRALGVEALPAVFEVGAGNGVAVKKLRTSKLKCREMLIRLLNNFNQEDYHQHILPDQNVLNTQHNHKRFRCLLYSIS